MHWRRVVASQRPCRRPWPGRIVAWVGRVAARTRSPLLVVSRAMQHLHLAPARPAPSASASALRAAHLRPTPAPCRGLGCALYCDTMPCLASCPWSQYTRCIAIQHLQQPSSSIAIHLLPTKLYCNTILNPLHFIYYNTMQYPAIQFLSLLASLIAIQFPVLQYKFFFPALKSFSCNTNLCQKD